MLAVAASLSVLALACACSAQAWRNEVSQWGITWTFAKPYHVGRFVNGDWWVVGPVKVTSITKPLATAGRDGSMTNPMPVEAQGLDDRGSTYRPALDVSLALPLALQPGDSLVSCLSDPQGHPPSTVRTWVRTAAVLTCVADVPPEGSFRPPYAGRTHKPMFHAANLDRTALLDLEPVTGTPSIASVERKFERLQYDLPAWDTVPFENLANYGRERAVDVGEAALLLLLDANRVGNKDRLLVAFVQAGIDTYGIVANGGGFPADGGTGQGRKWPLLFAGIVLKEQALVTAATDGRAQFGEDDQTFYVRETAPGVYNDGHGGYTKAEAGIAEWGIRHRTAPQLDSFCWCADYRQCCTANSFHGFVLAARLMGKKDLWRHDALFDYVDRYIVAQQSRSQDPDWFLSYSPFAMAMWTRYRHPFPVLPVAIDRTSGRIGGSGRDGVFDPKADVTLDTTSRICGFDYFTIRIRKGVTVSLVGTYPAILRSQGAVVIQGTLRADGSAAVGSTGGRPGAGGFAGGHGGIGAAPGGEGPGGGAGGIATPTAPGGGQPGRHSAAYGGAWPFDLRGGSGQGGTANPPASPAAGPGGGGGGGTVVVLADGPIRVEGAITARGGGGDANTGGGAAGSIMLRTLAEMVVSGVLDATGHGSAAPSGDGFIRLDSYGDAPVITGRVLPVPEARWLPCLREAMPLALGQTWRIEAGAAPGETVRFAASPRLVQLALPRLGVLRTDPAITVWIGTARVAHDGAEPVAALELPMPNIPSLLGTSVFAQAINADTQLPAGPRLSNHLATSVR